VTKPACLCVAYFSSLLRIISDRLIYLQCHRTVIDLDWLHRLEIRFDFDKMTAAVVASA
jgi:hypothetical protein